MTVYDQIKRNKRRTILLMVVFVIILLAIGYFGAEVWIGSGGGPAGLVLAAGIAAVMIPVSYFGGDSVALFSAGAHEVTFEGNAEIYRLVENLCIASGMPMPKIYIIEDATLNAFATGRTPEKASIALTTGLVQHLERSELEAVIAHELSHIQNYDTRLMMIVVILVGAIALLADLMWRARFFGGGDRNENRAGGQAQLILMIVGIALVVLSPIISELIKLAISRKREYLADASAVLMTRYAEGLIGALRKIEHYNTNSMARANHATAHMYFANPFAGKKLFSKLFSTHPPIEERIKSLAEMGGIELDKTEQA